MFYLILDISIFYFIITILYSNVSPALLQLYTCTSSTYKTGLFEGRRQGKGPDCKHQSRLSRLWSVVSDKTPPKEGSTKTVSTVPQGGNGNVSVAPQGSNSNVSAIPQDGNAYVSVIPQDSSINVLVFRQGGQGNISAAPKAGTSMFCSFPRAAMAIFQRLPKAGIAMFRWFPRVPRSYQWAL